MHVHIVRVEKEESERFTDFTGGNQLTWTPRAHQTHRDSSLDCICTPSTVNLGWTLENGGTIGGLAAGISPEREFREGGGGRICSSCAHL